MTPAATADPQLMKLILRVSPPLTPDEVARLTEPLTEREIARAKDDIDVRAILADPELSTNPRVFATCLGSLRALGYGWDWLAARTGVTVQDLRSNEGLTPDRMRTALTIAVRIKSRWATPDSTGQGAEETEVAAVLATAEGYAPPAAYDQLYAYVPRNRRKQDEAREDRGAVRIRALQRIITVGETSEKVGEGLGIGAHRVDSACRAVGLRREKTSVTLRGGRALAPGQDELQAAITAAADELDRGGDPRATWLRLLAVAKELQVAAACTVCGRTAQGGSLTLCAGHFARLRRHGSVRAHIPIATPQKKGAAA